MGLNLFKMKGIGSMPYGFNGKILRVDLTQNKIAVENLDEIIYRTYMGGSALALYYLLKETEPGIDPLAPENMLVFMASVMTGAPLPGFTRYTVASKSPITGAFAESEAGGFWGPELKFAGFDGIVIEGRSESPVYLFIKDGRAELRDASHLWGRDTGEVQSAIREELQDKRVRIAQCGPAGENLVKYACVLNELKHVNGRTGLGAVMGSKHLRAIAVRGSDKPEAADPEKVRSIAKKVAELIPRSKVAMNYRHFGTPIFVRPLNEAGILPTRNFQLGKFDQAESLSAEVYDQTISVGNKGCYGCPIRCKRAVQVEGTYQASPEYGGPEYETLAALGSLCGVGHLGAVAQGNEMCNRWGLDTISTGVTIAFAMECFEEGIVKAEDTDHIDLKFGNAEGMLEMIRRIAFRKGLGNILAEGVRGAAEKLSKGTEKFAMHVKGLELPLHDPRGKKALSLSYSTSPTGADHIEAPHETVFVAETEQLKSIKPLGILEPLEASDFSPRKVRQFTHTQQIFSLFNTIGMCNFAAAPYSAFTLPLIAEAVAAMVGWNTSLYELMELGERATTMARMFNVREGFTRADDYLPDRLYEPLEPGTADEKSISREEFNRALDLYYEAMGWNPQTGIPTHGRLSFLGLDGLLEKSVRKEKPCH
jgi:aldehyde:ferredoxin oxidoreductase